MENITVCVRIKPNSRDEENLWKIESNSIASCKSKELFTYDHIISPETSNESLFKNIIKNNIDNCLKGINLSIFAYGQTSTGKTFTMKGGSNNLNGIIPLSICEIFQRLSSDKSIKSVNIKASYLEIYNETVNDLLDGNKKNLEIRESLQKGIFINGLTEISVTTPEKAIQLLKQGDNIRVTAETKLNEKSSRSHTIFRLQIEITRILPEGNNKIKTFQSMLNLIDLAGSENVSKAKTDGIRMKEGGNINKSLLALSNVIHKLSTPINSNVKTFINYRDSKLTRLLQPALSGNSKTMIICTITEMSISYSETMNTLHFGNKAKNIRTSIKVNEMLDDKSKILQENNQLKNKIKELEDMIVEGKKHPNEVNVVTVNQLNNRHEDMISTLEKEVNLLKRILVSNEEIGDIDSNIGDNLSATNSNNNQHSYHINNGSNYISNNNLLSSSQKPVNQRINHSMLMSSGKKMTDSARKINNFSFINNRDRDNFQYMNMNTNMNQLLNNNNNSYNGEQNNNSVFRRCMTDMKMNNFTSMTGGNNDRYSINNNNPLMNTQMKKNTYIPTSAFKNPGNDDFDFQFPSNNNAITSNNNNSFDPYMNSSNHNNNNNNEYFNLLKENDEIRKNLYEVRKNFIETVSSKDQQIKSLNYNLNLTIENCEKLIREAEENYINLKMNYDRVREDILNKDNEVKILQTSVRNLESLLNNKTEEINKMNMEIINLQESSYKDNKAKELEMKYKEILINYEKLSKIYESEKNIFNEVKQVNEKLKNDLQTLKSNYENVRSENLSTKTQNDVVKKNNEMLINENSKLKNDIESYKNELAGNKDKMNKMKGEINSLNKNNGNVNNNSNSNNSSRLNNTDKKNPNNNQNKFDEYEKTINNNNVVIQKLENEILTYKSNLIKIEETQIVEYQKLLDESFNTIADLQNQINLEKEKNNYLEKVLKINNQSSKKEGIMLSAKGTPVKSNYPHEIVNTPQIKVVNVKNVSQFSFAENESSTQNIGNKNQENIIPPLQLLPLCEGNFENIENIKLNNNQNTSEMSSNGKDFIGKKRKHLPIIYQNMVEKNISNNSSRNNENTPRKLRKLLTIGGRENESCKSFKDGCSTQTENKENLYTQQKHYD